MSISQELNRYVNNSNFKSNSVQAVYQNIHNNVPFRTNDRYTPTGIVTENGIVYKNVDPDTYNSSSTNWLTSGIEKGSDDITNSMASNISKLDKINNRKTKKSKKKGT